MVVWNNCISRKAYTVHGF